MDPSNHTAMLILEKIFAFKIESFENLSAFILEQNKEYLCSMSPSDMQKEYGMRDINARSLALVKALDKCRSTGCSRSELSGIDREAIALCDMIIAAFAKNYAQSGGFFQDLAHDSDAVKRVIAIRPRSNSGDLHQAAKEQLQLAKALHKLRPLVKEFCQAMSIKMKGHQIG